MNVDKEYLYAFLFTLWFMGFFFIGNYNEWAALAYVGSGLFMHVLGVWDGRRQRPRK